MCGEEINLVEKKTAQSVGNSFLCGSSIKSGISIMSEEEQCDVAMRSAAGKDEDGTD